ncbi:hypothetical protein PRUPE_6G100300 [Prunus persica]|uniref:Uncharacterized protein n=1 Tax=Prunus persica TaxID=3760 RepID=A0A251NMZ6_PRUPE|nr:hypothetical protein PRUPE_6G100300 [Prunus persica]
MDSDTTHQTHLASFWPWEAVFQYSRKVRLRLISSSRKVPLRLVFVTIYPPCRSDSKSKEKERKGTKPKFSTVQ